jgi:hypothetical protein
MGDKNDRNCSRNIREAVCIDTKRVYDSCKDKDCCRDLRVYFTRCDQAIVDRAISIRAREAEIIWVFSDVEAIPFNRGCYSIDINYFFKVSFDVFTGGGQPARICGLAVYDKKVILFGSEGNAKIFSSKYVPEENDIQLCSKTNLPEATVEVVDPIVLASRLVDPCDCCCCCLDVDALPQSINGSFDDDFIVEGDKIILVTLGLFTIVRLSRNVQLLVPIYDFCIPHKECDCGLNDPCDLFNQFKFPIDEFFPPSQSEFDSNCGCPN